MARRIMTAPRPEAGQQDDTAIPEQRSKGIALLKQLGHPAWAGIGVLTAVAVGACSLALAVLDIGPAGDPATTVPSLVPDVGQSSPRESRPSGTSGSQQASDSRGAPLLIVDKSSYALRRSSFIDTNDQDKVDLDTGCPGWGAMHPRFGPARCGELADIILDEEGLHTAGGRPGLIALPLTGEEAGYESCRAAFAEQPNRSVHEIGVRDLDASGGFCVETDRGNIAAVWIDDLSVDTFDELEAATISFQVWTPAG